MRNTDNMVYKNLWSEEPYKGDYCLVNIFSFFSVSTASFKI